MGSSRVVPRLTMEEEEDRDVVVPSGGSSCITGGLW